MRDLLHEPDWSRKFLDAVKSSGIASRIERGLAYAMSGRVADLDVLPGVVLAKVRGSDERPYRVVISIDCLDDAQWTAICRILCERARYLADLLSGTLPEDINDAFVRTGASLFLKRNEQLQMVCSCPDDAVPCKHVAAVFYALAWLFDEHPLLLFEWRGRSQEQLVDEIRALRRSGRDDDDIVDSQPDIPDGWPEIDDVIELDDERFFATFWDVGPELAEVRTKQKVSPIPSMVLRQLDETMVDPLLLELLAPMYDDSVDAIARGAW
jgi:uncharacterized Zn finger protein